MLRGRFSFFSSPLLPSFSASRPFDPTNLYTSNCLSHPPHSRAPGATCVLKGEGQGTIHQAYISELHFDGMGDELSEL